MRITINGQQESVDDSLSVGDLLRKLDLDPVRVAVEVNEELVPRKIFAETDVHDGDCIEIVTFVGGG